MRLCNEVRAVSRAKQPTAVPLQMRLCSATKAIRGARSEINEEWLKSRLVSAVRGARGTRFSIRSDWLQSRLRREINAVSSSADVGVVSRGQARVCRDVRLDNIA